MKRHTLIPKQNLPLESPRVVVRYLEPEPTITRHSFQEAHRDNYYIFLFQQSGESCLMVDFEEVCLTGACVFCIRPSQVHHYLSISNVTGWIVAAHSLAIDKTFTMFFEEQNQLVPLRLGYPMTETLGFTVKALKSISIQEDNIFSAAVISHMISTFVGLITNMYRGNANENLSKTGRPFDITRSFRKMVRDNSSQLKRPAHYADKLAISTAYLNECVRFVTGMSVTYWIKQENILEAKRLLFYSTLSIKEISIRLGYEDVAYFSRVFSQVAKMTPVSFRKSCV
jgi:AraC family transcriptional activator of pobA